LKKDSGSGFYAIIRKSEKINMADSHGEILTSTEREQYVITSACTSENIIWIEIFSQLSSNATD